MVIAWFSPLPPSTSGIAAYSAELLPLLAARGHTIDTYTESNAHDFVWRQRRQPYDLTVYQLGNASCHDYMWAYLFRYPGLLVLHDVQLHQARALFLTRRWLPRTSDYMAEVRANHPDAPVDLPYLVLARMGDRMYQHWPMVRLVLERSRLTVVHNQRVADELRAQHPMADVRALEMGVGDLGPRPQAPGPELQAPGPRPQAPDAGPRVSGPRPQAPGPGSQAPGSRPQAPDAGPQASGARRKPPEIPEDATIIAAFGGITPEKRIPQLIRAVAAIAPRHPDVHLVLVGRAVDHYDAIADAGAEAIADRVHLSGFVSEDELAHYLAMADVCACLRWPTNRETSASWLRCLAAARPTIITELTHLGDVPTLDPRGWKLLNTAHVPREPVAVSIDILDEEHSLQLALERLVGDRDLRNRLGRAARAWWAAHHRLDAMAARYDDLLRSAVANAAPTPDLPGHLLDDGTTQLRALAGGLGVDDRIAGLL